MTPAPFRRLLVIGAGLLGTSLALAVRRRWPDVQLTAVDTAAGGHAPFDRHLDAAATLPEADLTVLACPLDAYPPWMARLAGRPGAVVTDVGSLKRAPAAAAAAAGVGEFVGGHPMAGGTQPGPETARATLFDDRPWYVVGGTASPSSVATVVALAAGCGARVIDTTADAHDAVVAAISHLPQLTATLLMATVGDAADDAALGAAGAGLRDTTRLADSRAAMWLPIVRGNADHLAPLLRDLAARTTAAADALGRDDGAVAALFAAARAARRRLPPV